MVYVIKHFEDKYFAKLIMNCLKKNDQITTVDLFFLWNPHFLLFCIQYPTNEIVYVDFSKNSIEYVKWSPLNMDSLSWLRDR